MPPDSPLRDPELWQLTLMFMPAVAWTLFVHIARDTKREIVDAPFGTAIRRLLPTFLLEAGMSAVVWFIALTLTNAGTFREVLGRALAAGLFWVMAAVFTLAKMASNRFVNNEIDHAVADFKRRRRKDQHANDEY